ncbi:MAG TPA: thioredoxin domain-containing protein [Vulgatibacter sp.]
MRKHSIVLLALSLVAASCAREAARGTSARAETPAAPAPAPKPSLSAEEAAAALPGFPMESVPSYLRETLVEIAQDEFVYDGSPYTLAGCLRESYPCKVNAMRGLTLLTAFLNAGAGRSEALTAYNRYYRSFEKAQRQTIDTSTAVCRGPADAPLRVVEFSDFECPHCAAVRPLLEGLVESRTDTQLCFMHFPLPMHSNASSAAQATVFAARHGKFWQLHDKIFDNQQRLSVDVIKQLVAQVGLDPQELVKAVAADELSPVVEAQKAEGQRLGIQGTPSIYLNGRKLEPPLTPELLRFTLDDEVRWTAGGGGWSK